MTIITVINITIINITSTIITITIITTKTVITITTTIIIFISTDCVTMSIAATKLLPLTRALPGTKTVVAITGAAAAAAAVLFRFLGVLSFCTKPDYQKFTGILVLLLRFALFSGRSAPLSHGLEGGGHAICVDKKPMSL